MLARFFRRVRLLWALLLSPIPFSFWKVMTMPNPKIQELLAKLAELEPLSEAKDTAIAAKAEADSDVAAAAETLNLAQIDAAAAQEDYDEADAAYDAKWEEIKALATAAQGD